MKESLSTIGENIVGSQIININNQIKSVKNKKIYNYTIGDFDPKIHQIPSALEDLIINEYRNNNTNYPTAQGELALRETISNHYKGKDIDYSPSEILIGAGVRPLIYTIFKTVVSLCGYILYPVPSWNNDHYTFISNGNCVPITTLPENQFNLTPEDVANNISKVKLICLCSPQNPTGSIMSADSLKQICELVLEKNRAEHSHKHTYILYDQIYSELSDIGYHPLTVCPDIKPYLICVDGISKSLSATGVRVGWMMGSEYLIKQATQIFSHIGAWAPKPEQLAVAKYYGTKECQYYIEDQITHFNTIQKKFISIINKFRPFGFDYIIPDGGIYLSIKLPYRNTTTDLDFFMRYLINECGFGVVPFDYFGCTNSEWFRMSFGGTYSGGAKLLAELEHFHNVLVKLKEFFMTIRKID